jgi:hypothetical protein
MFVKTKERAGRVSFFLCIAEGGGSAWKSVEYSVCLGETLDLSAEQWVKILRSSSDFRSASLQDVLDVLERYLEDRGMRTEALAGLREAVRGAKQRKSRRNANRDAPSPHAQDDERGKALRVLGVPPGSSNDQIESAFRKAARRHHPDVGGDPAKFRALLDARNLLLGRLPRQGEIA